MGGRPQLDNGTEFTANVFDAWAYERGIALHFITPRVDRISGPRGWMSAVRETRIMTTPGGTWGCDDRREEKA